MDMDEVPGEIKEVSRRMKVIYLEKVSDAGDPWEKLKGMFTIGKAIDVEDLIKTRWLQYDEDIGF